MTTEAVDQARPAEITVEQFAELAAGIEGEVKRVIVGQDELVRQTLICLVANGHALLEGVPGLGKTMLVRTLADVIDCEFNRIQFTPDLMPADIVGTNILVEAGRPARASVSSRARSSPTCCSPTRSTAPRPRRSRRCSRRCRSSRSRSLGDRHRPPAAVLRAGHAEPARDGRAPIPLPEAQLDRFLFKLWVPFPSEEDLDHDHGADHRRGPAAGAEGRPMPRRSSRCSGWRAACPRAARHGLRRRVLRATHPDAPRAPELVRQYVRYGGSPRGAQALVLARQDPCPARRSLQRVHRRRARGRACRRFVTASSATSRARPKASRATRSCARCSIRCPRRRSTSPR